MVDVSIADLLLVLSLVAGTAALTLCLLTWNILRRSIVGRFVLVLTVVLGLFNLYHGVVLLVPESRLLSSVLKSVTFTAVLVFVATSIRMQNTVRRAEPPGGER